MCSAPSRHLARGGVSWCAMGKPLSAAKVCAKAPAVQQVNADAFAESMVPFIREALAEGATTLRAVAASLNERGVSTASGRRKWEAATVSYLLKRVSARAEGRGVLQ
jgi:hypothetical protein